MLFARLVLLVLVLIVLLVYCLCCRCHWCCWYCACWSCCVRLVLLVLLVPFLARGRCEYDTFPDSNAHEFDMSPNPVSTIYLYLTNQSPPPPPSLCVSRSSCLSLLYYLLVQNSLQLTPLHSNIHLHLRIDPSRGPASCFLQDFFYVFMSVSSTSAEARQLTLDFFRANFAAIKRKLEKSSPSLMSTTVLACCGGFASHAKAAELEQLLLKDLAEDLALQSRSISQMLEETRSNADFVEELKKSRLADAANWEEYVQPRGGALEAQVGLEVLGDLAH